MNRRAKPPIAPPPPPPAPSPNEALEGISIVVDDETIERKDWRSATVSAAIHFAAVLSLALVLAPGSTKPHGPRSGALIDTTLNAPELNEVQLARLDDGSATDKATGSSDDDPSTLEANLNLRRMEVAAHIPRPAMSSDALDPQGNLAGGMAVATRVGGQSSAFAGRSGEAKRKLVKSEGGTEDSENAVELGLQWLAKHQRKDGRWGLACHDACPRKGGGCPVEEDIGADAAATGLALLCFQGAGHIHNGDSPHRTHVERGLNWLIGQQAKNGGLHVTGRRSHTMYSHAIATMAVCEAYGLTHDRRLREPAQRAVNFLVAAQNPNGGWRYVPGMSGDTSVLGWQMLALRAAKFAELNVPDRAFLGAASYLNRALSGTEALTYSYKPGGRVSMVMTAEALLCRQILGIDKNHPALTQGSILVLRDVLDNPERNIYYWYYAAQLFHNLKDETWTAWNPKARDYLVNTQDLEPGCYHGSWDPLFPYTANLDIYDPDAWGDYAGRHYQTTMSILTLEVYYRYVKTGIEERGAETSGPRRDVAKAAR